MSWASTFRFCSFILNTIRLVDSLYWIAAILVTFLMKQLIPTLKLWKYFKLLYPRIHFTPQKIANWLLDVVRVKRILNKLFIRAATQKSEQVCSNHSKLPIKREIRYLFRSSYTKRITNRCSKDQWRRHFLQVGCRLTIF